MIKDRIVTEQIVANYLRNAWLAGRHDMSPKSWALWVETTELVDRLYETEDQE